MKTRLIAGTLLVTGCAIGGGILALPIATAELGFIYSSLLLFFCWFLMTASAFLILEVTLWLPKNTNLISMTKATLGRSGQLVAWVTYLLLLYSLVAAYIAGGSDFLKNVLHILHVGLPDAAVSFLFTALLGYIVFLGIHAVDHVNRGLMLLKFLTFFLLVGLVSSHVSPHKLTTGHLTYLTPGLTVAITSFGFATMIPSLRNYFHDDVKQLRIAILVGSLIPLVLYILWNITVMGVIPREGQDGLMAILQSGRSTSEFVNILSALLNKQTITTCANLFTSICLFTSFLSVSLCLSDFLADGFSVEKKGKNSLWICFATLFPPLLIVWTSPGIFIAALAYAGIYCVILLVILPVLMTWCGRYRKKIARGYQVTGGKPLLIILLVGGVLTILQSIITLME